MRITGPIGLSNVGRFFNPQGLAADFAPDDPMRGGGVPVIVTVDDPPLPQRNNKLVLGEFVQAVIEQPVKTLAWLSVVLAAWTPAYAQPQLPSKIAAVLAVVEAPAVVNNPPGTNVPRFVEIADPLPTLPKRNIVQPGIVQIDNPPFGGRKPYVWPPREADPLPTLARKIAGSLPADKVPFERVPWWGDYTPAVLPTLPRKIAAVLAGSDRVPFRRDPIWWQPPAPPLPTLPAKRLFEPETAADNPPFGKRRYQDWFHWYDSIAVRLTVSTAATEAAAVVTPPTVDNPPFSQRRQSDWFHWYDTVAVKLTVSRAATEGAAVTPPAVVDNPPFGLYRPQVWTWGPLTAFPATGGQLDPETVDNPPFSQRVVQDWQHWFQPYPLPVQKAKLVQPGAAAPPPTVDNPSGKGVPRIVTVADPPLPTLPPKLVQPAIVVQPDNPPFSQRRRQDWTHWFQPYPLPTLNTKLIQPERVDNPPFNQRHELQQANWPPFVPLPTLTAKLVQPYIPPPVNDPPFNSRRRPDWFHWFDTVPVRLVVSYAATEGAPSVPVVEPPVEPPVVAPSPGGVGRLVGRGGKPLYKTVRLKKKRLKEECEELLKYLADLPPAKAQEICEALPAERLSLLDGLVLPHGIVLKTTATTIEVLVEEDEDEEEIALLLGILFDA